MKVIGFDKKEHTWTLKSSELADDSRSKLHLKARALLERLFPYDRIHEDVTLPGSNTPRRKSLLYADFYLPNRGLIIEVNGEQHSNHVAFFHKTKHDYLKATLRDREKRAWCDMNGLTLVCLEYDQSVEKWEELINGR
jgi:hypothetical protein